MERKTVHGMTGLDLIGVAIQAYRSLIRQLEVKAPQLRTEAEKAQLREAKRQLRVLRAELKNFQMRLF